MVGLVYDLQIGSFTYRLLADIDQAILYGTSCSKIFYYMFLLPSIKHGILM